MRRRAFSLIEMLIVVAVIVVLAALILSVFTATKAKAQATSCQGRLHEIGIAVTLYRNDNDGHSFSYVRESAQYKPGLAYWTPIAGYLSSSDIVWCPVPPSLEASNSNLFSYRAWSRDTKPTLYFPFVEEPSSVLAYCTNHTSADKDPRAKTEPPLRAGRYTFVREDGSASSASNRQIQLWYYDKDWQWTQTFKAPMRTLFRFPNEPWPPKPDFAE